MEERPPGIFVAIRGSGRGKSYLFVKHTYSGCLWSLPGGRRKAKEDVSRTGIRETKAETGLNIRVVRDLGSFRPFKPETSGSRIRLLQGQIKGGELLEHGDGYETSECKFWDIQKINETDMYPAQYKLVLWADILIDTDNFYEGPLVYPPFRRA